MIYYRFKDQFKLTKSQLFNPNRSIYIENDDLYQKRQPKGQFSIKFDQFSIYIKIFDINSNLELKSESEF